MSLVDVIGARCIRRFNGYIVEDGPPEQVIGNPQHERTQLFLARVLNPTAVEEGDEFSAPPRRSRCRTSPTTAAWTSP